MNQFKIKLVSIILFIALGVFGTLLILPETLYPSNYMLAPENQLPITEIVFNFYHGAYSVIPLFVMLLGLPMIEHYQTVVNRIGHYDDNISLRIGKKTYLNRLFAFSFKP